MLLVRCALRHQPGARVQLSKPGPAEKLPRPERVRAMVLPGCRSPRRKSSRCVPPSAGSLRDDEDVPQTYDDSACTSRRSSRA